MISPALHNNQCTKKGATITNETFKATINMNWLFHLPSQGHSQELIHLPSHVHSREHYQKYDINNTVDQLFIHDACMRRCYDVGYHDNII